VIISGSLESWRFRSYNTIKTDFNFRWRLMNLAGQFFPISWVSPFTRKSSSAMCFNWLIYTGDPHFSSYKQYSSKTSSSAIVKRCRAYTSSSFDFSVRSDIRSRRVSQGIPRHFIISRIDARPFLVSIVL